MIFGVILRNYKSYQRINYVPISNGKNFSAIVGENGAGKSSVLEALDSYFNNTEWNLNHSISKGFKEREPIICPIFLIKKTEVTVKREDSWFFDGINEVVWTATHADFNPSVKGVVEQFCAHRDMLEGEGITSSEYYLLPAGYMKNSHTGAPEHTFSIFETNDVFAKILNNYLNAQKLKIALYSLIGGLYRYIYLPSEIDFKEYTKIESKTIQALLGKKIDDIVRGFIKKATIQEINKRLNDFLQEISKTLENYEYRKPARKQNLFNQSHFTEKVIEAFFESKVLTKSNEKEPTPVNNLSSGEKRQALIDVARAFLTTADQSGTQRTILAIDEPELSLHISSCFEQFEKLKDITTAGVQTIITTHWYGFMPAIANGVAIYCPKTDDNISLIDLRCFREDIAKLKRSTKGRLPAEIELKGVNDLVQSIIASVTGGEHRWIICEGSSDKIYIDHYFSHRKVYVLPVGGSRFVKKIYNYIEMALEDNRDDVKGRVFLVLDTDKNFEKFDAKESLSQIRIRRLQNNDKEFRTQLLTTSNNEYYPPTVIEDTLIAEDFLETLKHFKNVPIYRDLYSEIDDLKESLSEIEKSKPSYLALDLRPTAAKALNALFEAERFKVKFALKYVSIADSKNPPNWIKEIDEFLFPVRAKPARARK